MKKLIRSYDTNDLENKKATVTAASNDDEYTFSDMLSDIKDNFDYLIDGLTLLDNAGEMKSHEIAQDLMDSIQQGILDVSAVNVGVENEENNEE